MSTLPVTSYTDLVLTHRYWEMLVTLICEPPFEALSVQLCLMTTKL